MDNLNMSTTFDTKLDHLLTNYFSASSDQHDIRQTFIYKNITTFDLIIDTCTLGNLKKMEQKSGDNLVSAFTVGKLKLVHDELLYYNFIMNDSK